MAGAFDRDIPTTTTTDTSGMKLSLPTGAQTGKVTTSQINEQATNTPGQSIDSWEKDPSRKPGDIFDWSIALPGDTSMVGVASKFIETSNRGGATTETIQSSERTNWRDTIAGANNYQEALAILRKNGIPEGVLLSNTQWRNDLIKDRKEQAAGKPPQSIGTTANGQPIYSYDASGNPVTTYGSTTGQTGGAGTTGSNLPFGTTGATNTAAGAAGATGMTNEQYTERTDIRDTLYAKFKDYGLEALIPTIEKLAMEGATESTIFLTLRESDVYKQRFSANEDRKKAGLAVLDPRTYIAVEDGYRQTLRLYGLTQFDNDNYVKQFIANDMSPTELSNRVSMAVQRVQNADPSVLKTLRDYYGIGSADLVAYTLDPATQFEKIKRQVSAAEIGATARMQGLQSDVGVSEALAMQGVTQDEAQRGYAAIADVLPTAEKLSAIYGNQTARYGQDEAEQETFNNLASAQRKRQQLTNLEVGSFSGQSGTSRTGLSSNKSGQF